MRPKTAKKICCREEILLPRRLKSKYIRDIAICEQNMATNSVNESMSSNQESLFSKIRWKHRSRRISALVYGFRRWRLKYLISYDGSTEAWQTLTKTCAWWSLGNIFGTFEAPLILLFLRTPTYHPLISHGRWSCSDSSVVNREQTSKWKPGRQFKTLLDYEPVIFIFLNYSYSHLMTK